MRSHQTVAREIIGVTAAVLAALVAVPATGVDAQGGVATISPERAAALAVNELEAVEGGYQVRSPTLRASFSAGGLELRPRGSDLRWSWRFTRLEPGGKASVGPIPPASPEAGLLRYGRGILDEEYELEAEGIEQRFVLHAPPPLDSGDLVLEGEAVCHAELRAAGGGWEWRGGRGMVRLGPATITDATGAILPSFFEVNAATTRLVVASTALAGAAYPLTIDLEIRAYSLRISDMGGTGDPYYQTFWSDVAYNSAGNQYLVVWSGDETGSGFANDEFEIFGQRLDAATGTAVGTNDFRISNMGGTGDPNYSALWPAAAYNSTNNEYLVVWSGDDEVGGLIAGEYEIFGQRLDAATGAELGANDFRISDMGATGDPSYGAWSPAVAYNSTNNEYLVVWDGWDNVGGLVSWEFEIFVQRLDAVAGGSLGYNDLRISDMGGTGDPNYGAWSPAVAYNSADNRYLVVWTGDDDIGGLVEGEYEIFGELMDAATLTQLGGNDFRISDMGGTGDPNFDAESPAVAYNSTNDEFLVEWDGDDNVGGLSDNEYEIFSQRLDAETGSPVGANDFRISDMGGTGNADFTASYPAVTFSSTADQFLVVWCADDNVGGLIPFEFEIFGQRLDASTGAQVSINDFRISEMGGTGSSLYAAFDASVASGSPAGQFLVVWSGDDNTGGLVDDEFEIFGKMLGILPFEDGFESGDTSAWSTTVP
jgi:hypothetical protein